ncbi:UNVERIFIED_ORG: prophage antirepressor-like protein [Pseudomonas fluorescens]|nr:prophage antirepressor-like protein [Pseudomonas fluorescens]
MGIELDALVGHPEHELLFVAYQVASVVGLKNAKSSVSNIRINHGLGRQVAALVQHTCTEMPVDPSGKAMRSNVVMFNESEVYRMLMSSRAPQTEPFRKWVTEEVLPTIRKTGKYDAEQSSNPAVMRI